MHLESLTLGSWQSSQVWEDQWWMVLELRRDKEKTPHGSEFAAKVGPLVLLCVSTRLPVRISRTILRTGGAQVTFCAQQTAAASSSLVLGSSRRVEETTCGCVTDVEPHCWHHSRALSPFSVTRKLYAETHNQQHARCTPGCGQHDHIWPSHLHIALFRISGSSVLLHLTFVS